MKEKNIDELVEKIIIKMIEEEPAKMLTFLVSQAGKAVVESNADELILKSECTYRKKRYKVKCLVTIEPTSHISKTSEK